MNVVFTNRNRQILPVIPLSYPPTLPLAPPVIQSHLSCETSQHLRDGLAQKFLQTFTGSQRMNPNDCGHPLTFHIAPSSGQKFEFAQYYDL